MSKRLRPNGRSGIARLEQSAPAPSRRIVQDPEFVRDLYAIVGVVADLGQQHRPIVVDHVIDGVAVSFRGGIHTMLAISGDMLIGAIDGKPVHDNRTKYGPAWQAVSNLLERQGIDPAISDREPVEVA